MAEINNTNAFTNIINKQKIKPGWLRFTWHFRPLWLPTNALLRSYYRQTSRAVVATFYTIHI